MAKITSAGNTRRASAKIKSRPALKTKSSSSLSARRPALRTKAKASDPKLTKEPAPLHRPGFKFVLTPPPPPAPQPPAYEYLGELPEAYGTKRLFLVARDPYFLFAYWDLTDAQHAEAEASAHDGKLFLEIFVQGQDIRRQQVHLPRGLRHCYLPVNQPGLTFSARLGYYQADGGFTAISRSGEASTPRDSLSWRTDARFVTIPFHLSYRELYDLIRAQMQAGETLAVALARLQEEGARLPFAFAPVIVPAAETPDALLAQLGPDFTRRIKIGSMEITEIIRRRFQEIESSGGWSLSSSPSSPFGASFGRAGQRGFFMHVNAELIIYGGTDPEAKVQINGQEIKLRDDGTFSYHFTLPDGRFHIPIEATSPDAVEKRTALLSFLRASDYNGEVNATAQTPRPEPIGRQA